MVYPSNSPAAIAAPGNVTRNPHLGHAQGRKFAQYPVPSVAYLGNGTPANQVFQDFIADFPLPPPPFDPRKPPKYRLKRRIEEVLEKKVEEPDNRAPIGSSPQAYVAQPEAAVHAADIAPHNDGMSPFPNARIIQFINEYRNQLLREAAKSETGELLLSVTYKKGWKLVKSLGQHSLKKALTSHPILIDKVGSIFIRATKKPFTSGSYKKIFKAVEYGTLRSYAWTEMESYQLMVFNTPSMKRFSEFLEANPGCAFTPVPRFFSYVMDQQQVRGVYVGTLYKGDAGELRQQKNEPIFLAPAIVGLAESLAALHNAGFVHRDIKDQNILFDADGRAFFHDYDFLCKAGKKDMDVDGTDGYNSLEYVLKDNLNTPLENEDLYRADVFAFAVTLYKDLENDFQKPGYHADLWETYQREIQAISGINPAQCPPKQQNEALNQWLAWKQREHDASVPQEDGKPYLAYRQFLWTAMSPIFVLRPDAAAFEAGLKELAQGNELPTFKDPVV